MGACVALQLGMPYPLNGLVGPHIDLAALQEQKAVQPGEELIIRLETISEKGLAEGHSLSVLFPTCPLFYAQCRTLCSSSRARKPHLWCSGAYAMLPVRQRTWSNGSCQV